MAKFIYKMQSLLNIKEKLEKNGRQLMLLNVNAKTAKVFEKLMHNQIEGFLCNSQEIKEPIL